MNSAIDNDASANVSVASNTLCDDASGDFDSTEATLASVIEMEWKVLLGAPDASVELPVTDDGALGNRAVEDATVASTTLTMSSSSSVMSITLGRGRAWKMIESFGKSNSSNSTTCLGTVGSGL